MGDVIHAPVAPAPQSIFVEHVGLSLGLGSCLLGRFSFLVFWFLSSVFFVGQRRSPVHLEKIVVCPRLTPLCPRINLVD